MKEAIEVAREQASDDEPFEYNGYLIRVLSIPAAIISDVTNKIPEPVVPVWHNKEYDRDEENKSDPGYIRAKDEVDRKRGEAIMDAVVLFGIELVNGVPPTSEWLPKLQLMEKMGNLNLSSYDLSDPMIMEFVFKRYKLADMDLINHVQQISSVTSDDVEKAGKSFRRKTQR